MDVPQTHLASNTVTGFADTSLRATTSHLPSSSLSFVLDPLLLKSSTLTPDCFSAAETGAWLASAI